jgi:plastocyanin
MRKILFIGLVVTAVVLVSGCYAPTTGPNATVQPTGGTAGEITPVITVTGTSPTVATVNAVKITSAGYEPKIISVKRGTIVTWTNTDNVSHTVTSTTRAFDSSLASGKTYSYTFSTPGSYDYGDSTNPKISGTVIVT